MSKRILSAVRLCSTGLEYLRIKGSPKAFPESSYSRLREFLPESCSTSSWCGQQRWYSKGSKKQKKQTKKDVAETGQDANIDLRIYKRMMDNALEHMQHELANIRMGRATPGMLDHLKVEAYGEKMPMKAVGTVTVKDPQRLAVTVFDINLTEAVASSIATSPLGLTPRVEGQEIIIPIPRPTQDTLEAMKKLCKSEAEAAKVSIRHARKLAMDQTSKVLSEDARYQMEKEIQSLTNKYSEEVESISHRKQNDMADHNS